ncbi:MAG TPA: hypothetical protein VFV05_00495 [Methylomirabilota bacterium]|nr:hypothetical protein [Methylomirabilota bacterium]
MGYDTRTLIVAVLVLVAGVATPGGPLHYHLRGFLVATPTVS